MPPAGRGRGQGSKSTLTPPQEAEALEAIKMCQAQGLVKAAGGRGRPLSREPYAAAVAVLRGNFDRAPTGVRLSEESRVTAAATTFKATIASVNLAVQNMRQARSSRLQTMGGARH